MTTGTGCPVGNKTGSKTVGQRGPILLEDFVFTDEMAHFNRERIPERVVHAKGAGKSVVIFFGNYEKQSGFSLIWTKKSGVMPKLGIS